jgi:hypothetical protein
MGITSLKDAGQYGFTLVLGGGEVSLLEMTSAYGTFATNGIRNPYTAILSVEDSAGNKIKEFSPQPEQVIDPQVAMKINDVLSDNVARTPDSFLLMLGLGVCLSLWPMQNSVRDGPRHFSKSFGGWPRLSCPRRRVSRIKTARCSRGF